MSSLLKKNASTAPAALPKKPLAVQRGNDVTSNRLRIGGWILLAGVFLWSYCAALSHLAHRWLHEADYSHGFFVPVFAVALLWLRKDLFTKEVFASSGSRSAAFCGVILLLTSGAMRWASAYYQYLLLDPLSMIPCLAGMTLFLGGWPAARWAWPSVAFLVFMIPLPGVVAGMLSHPLQRIATIGSTYSLQTLGMPAVARGNVIWLTEAKIGVVEACSGLRMLNVFFALTVAASFLVKRPLWEKALIAVSAVGIGIVANIIRITATGIAHEVASREVADMIFHDLAGWLMMPLAMLLLFAECYLLSKLLIPASSESPLLPGLGDPNQRAQTGQA